MPRKNIVYGFIALGFVFSMLAISKKISLENTLKNVEVACDLGDVRRLADLSGKSIETVLAELKEAGITTIGISEQTIKNFEADGLLTVTDGREIEKNKYLFNRPPRFLESRQIKNRPEFIYVFTKNPSLGSFIKKALLKKLPEKAVSGIYTGRHYLVIATAKIKTAALIYLGFWEEEIETVKRAGLRFILRPVDGPLVDEAWIKTLFTEWKEDGKLSGVIVNGTKIPGKPETLAEVLKELKIPFGKVEFSKVAGVNKIARAGGKIFLCFSPPGANDNIKINAILRSAKERNIQLVYLHPNNESYTDFLSFAGSVKRILSENSFKAEKFIPLPEWAGNYYAFILIGFAIFMTTLFLLSIIYELSSQFKIAYVIVAVFSTIFFVKLTFFRIFLAFLATITFPVLAISKTWKRHALPPMLQAIHLFINVSLVTCIGALFVTGILSSTNFMLKIDIFRGVKLSLALPIVIAFVLLYGRERSYFSTSLHRLWHKRLELRHLFAGITIGVLFVLIILRSSNRISFMLPFEQSIRNLLEKLFFARPRFKEFLLGHPLMLLGLYLYPLASQAKKIKFRPFIILGLIGQVSIINTFAHIHSPITICLFRTFNGLILGILSGIILISLTKALHLIKIE